VKNLGGVEGGSAVDAIARGGALPPRASRSASEGALVGTNLVERLLGSGTRRVTAAAGLAARGGPGAAAPARLREMCPEVYNSSFVFKLGAGCRVGGAGAAAGFAGRSLGGHRGQGHGHLLRGLEGGAGAVSAQP
jgi:hypothetical protein